MDEAGAGAQSLPEEPSLKQQAAEVGVFLFLILPSLLLSFFSENLEVVQFPLAAAGIILRDLSLLSLVLFFLWRNGEPFERIGWQAANPKQEALIGLALFPAMLLATAVLQWMLTKLGVPPRPKPLPSALSPQTGWQFALGGVLIFIVAVAEETIFRGYLLLRLRIVTRSTSVAVLIASILFALGHGYEGVMGLLIVGFMGVIFALLYLWRESLIAPMVMHFCQNFLAVVLAPLFGGAL